MPLRFFRHLTDAQAAIFRHLTDVPLRFFRHLTDAQGAIFRHLTDADQLRNTVPDVKLIRSPSISLSLLFRANVKIRGVNSPYSFHKTAYPLKPFCISTAEKSVWHDKISFAKFTAGQVVLHFENLEAHLKTP